MLQRLTLTIWFGLLTIILCSSSVQSIEDEIDVSTFTTTLSSIATESPSTTIKDVTPKNAIRRTWSPFLFHNNGKPTAAAAASSPEATIVMSNESLPQNLDQVARKPTFRRPASAPLLKKIHDYLIVVLLVAVMFAMGCSITWAQVWSHICRPVGVLIGMLSQFFLLPFAAFCLIWVFQMDPLHATGLLILACSPGGVTSNIFAYFLEGDLSLSVTMTSFSTVVALFMMPFNVWLYGRNLETEALVIPYGKMTISLLSLTTPVAVGMIINWKLPSIAPILTQIGSVAGFAIIIVCQTLEVFIFPDIFDNVPSALYVAEFLLPLLGLILGFGAASIFGLDYPIRRTIAIEAGIQNVGTALTIITLSFPFEQLRKVWLFPFLYAFSMLAVCCVIAVLYRLQKRLGRKKSIDIADAFEANYPKLQMIQQPPPPPPSSQQKQMISAIGGNVHGGNQAQYNLNKYRL
ncbi:hypothetical protein RDWZM_010212 [Blomia tropicalis]|uniref:Ileal sodium/bile acid cotransporter n=1 Tax=Blomia tropicalis TaxID=40697 RepID=A0A9Q0M0J7_BLOTA|nr:hypothetical protein RDWZM_010212 [Blomia tropicalis]